MPPVNKGTRYAACQVSAVSSTSSYQLSILQIMMLGDQLIKSFDFIRPHRTDEKLDVGSEPPVPQTRAGKCGRNFCFRPGSIKKCNRVVPQNHSISSLPESFRLRKARS